jgi:hypothetical protein
VDLSVNGCCGGDAESAFGDVKSVEWSCEDAVHEAAFADDRHVRGAQRPALLEPRPRLRLRL